MYLVDDMTRVFGVTDAEAAIARVEKLGCEMLGRYGGDSCTSGW